MDDYRGHRGNEATDQWPGLPPELFRDWRNMPPVLKGPGVALREVETGDAATLLALLSRDEIAQVIAPPPQSASELQTRIEAARLERSDGRGICFSVVPERRSEPVGLFRVRELERGFGSAEWEFVLAPEYSGGGLFFAAASGDRRFRLRCLGSASSRSPRGRAQRPWQRRPAEDRRGTGRCTAPVAATGARMGGPDALDAHCRGLAPEDGSPRGALTLRATNYERRVTSTKFRGLPRADSHRGSALLFASKSARIS